MELYMTMMSISVVITMVTGSCSELKIIEGGSGEFQSPNFAKNEYGVKANCTWRLSSKQLTNYALKLNFTFLKLYYVNSSRKVCIPGSYNLTINGDQLGCQVFAREGSAERCHSYYNSDACSGLSEISSCRQVSEKAQFPVDVKYQSDGGTIEGEEIRIDGFKIQYSFIQCPSVTTTTTIEPTTATATTMTTGPAITTERTTSSRPTTTEVATTTTRTSTAATTRGITTVSLTTSESTNRSTSENGIVTSAPGATQATAFPLPIVAGVAGGSGLFLIIIVIVAVTCLKRRKAKSTPKEENVGDQEVQPVLLHNDIPMKQLNGYDPEEEPYTIMTGSSKDEKSVTGSFNDQISTSNQEPEQDPAYTVVNRTPQHGTHETSTGNPAADNVYSVIIKGPKDEKRRESTADETCAYTTMENKSTKTRTTSSNASQEDTTYAMASELTNGESQSLKNTGSTGVEIGGEYAIITNTIKTVNEMPDKSTENQDETSRLEDTYTVISSDTKLTLQISSRSQNDAADNTYAAITKDSEGKKTMHYEKEMVDNVLYTSPV